MLFRLKWWNSSRTRRSKSRALPVVAERLEARWLLFAGLEVPADTASVISELSSVENAAPAVDHADHDHGGVLGNIYLPTQYRLLGTGALLTGPTPGTPLDVALSFLNGHADELGLDTDDLSQFILMSQYTDEGSGTTHLYLRQTFGGLEVVHADISISLTAAGEVIHVASSFVSDAQVVESSSSQIVVNASQAFMEWSDDLGLGLQTAPQVIRIDSDSPSSKTLLALDGTTIEDVAANLVYVPTAEGLELAWRLDVHDSDYTHWLDAFVRATTGEVIYTDNRIGNATYNVFALPARSPIDGSRSIVSDPQDATASPFGWHDTNGVAGAEFTDTRGNNATAQEDVNADDAGGLRPSGGAGLSFDFPLDTTQDPHNSQSAAITNAFYWINLLHDIHYQYGFTEVAGNFQVNNYGRGGAGNDPVIVDIQDGASVGGGGFATLPDGQSPRMTLQRWTGPFRDGALDSDILIHEFGHGISERLTGGPGNTSALNAVQSRAMSEGWGDWWALMLTQVLSDAKLAAYPIGNYVAGFAPNGPGIRVYPYSFDMTIDPLTYNSFNGGAANNESHKAGTIWASALWDMNWLLIDKHGFSSDMLHGTGGNNLALQLVMDGLKLQGTNPSFLAGRDAILAADVALTGGQNQTEIWAAFARRGMGFSASDGGSASSTTVVEAFDVPGSISGTVFRDDDASGTQNGAEPGLSDWTVFLDLNNNGVLDVATTTTFNSTDTPKPLPDAPNILSTRTISGLVGVITDINVTVNLTHPNVGDLYVTLISPGNTPVIMANYLGGSGDNYTNTTFDDEAATYISTASAPFTGSFRPFFDLAQLDGRDPNGTWKLRIDDGAAGNTGTLLSWSMQITYGNPDPTAVTDANGNYAFYGLGNATHHVREILQSGFTQTAPASGVHNVVISGGQPVNGRNFGDRAAATVSNVATLEETLSPAIVITPTVGQGITHFKISGISNGSLFKNDGVTPISNGDFITVAEGQAGVKFLPAANSNVAGHIDVELSQNGSTVLAQTSKVTNTITVTPVGDTPQVANSTTLEDTLSGAIIIGRHPNDGNEVTHFRISGITGGTLFKSNGVTPLANGSFITFAEAQAGVRFLPSPNSTSAGHFDVESSQNGSTVAAQSGKATSTITVTPVGDTPQVANSATLEDTLSGPIVIGRHPSDGNEVTHFRISSISGGTLVKNDGVTLIANGNFITFAEAQAGVRFLPSPNNTSAGHFDVEASQNGSTAATQSGKATSTITVTPVGDTPQVASSATLEDTLSGPIVIGRHPNDGNEVTHFQISGISGGTLFKSDGVTQIANGTFITFAEAQAGVRFLPSAHSTSDGHFDVESSQNGSTVAAQSGKAASTITVTPVGDTPQIANSATLEDTLSSPIVIGRHPNDGSEVTHFKISGIIGGTLFKSDGVTQIASGNFITFAEAQAGVRFLPSAHSTSDGHFDVESSQNGSTVATQSGKATSTITVTPVGDTPQVANSATLEDTLSGPIVIGRHPSDGNEVTHFRISSISGGTLFKSDGVTQIASGNFITFAEAQAGVRFLPSPNNTSAGHFDVESSQNGSTVADQSSKATSTITVTPVGDTPQVANSATLEDTLSGPIVIGRHPSDGNEVTHFQISGIVGGTLFKNDGVTPIANGSFITFPEAQAGVRFLPTANSTADGHFDVESSQNGSTAAAQSGKATSTITVTPVNDSPTIAPIPDPPAILQDAGLQSIGLSGISAGGGEVQTLSIAATSDNPALIADPAVTYTQGNTTATLSYSPSANQHGTATITVTVNDGGQGEIVSRQFLVTVLALNTAPTSLELSNAALAENQPAGTVVGTFSTQDPDVGNTFTYTLAAGAGDTNNTSFQIVGNQLRTAGPFDFEAVGTYSIRVQSTDQDGLGVAAIFVVTVLDVNEAPTAVILQNVVPSLPENLSTVAAIPLASIQVTDDALGSETLTLTGPDAAFFQIVGSELQLKPGVTLNFESRSSYSVTINANDPTVGATPDALTTLILTITNVNEPPKDITLPASNLAENNSANATVGTLSASDPDSGNTFTYTLVSGIGSTDNGSFSIIGNTLMITPSTDFETQSSYSILVQVADQSGLTFQRQLTINISDVNEPPTLITLQNVTTTLPENTNTAGAVTLADIVVTDDALGSETLTLSGPDAAFFQIMGNELQLKAGVVLNFEVQTSYAVTVNADDTTVGVTPDASANLSLTITNVNESPTDVALSSTSLAENNAANVTVGTLSASDPDSGNTFTYTLVSGTGSTDNGSFTIAGNSLKITPSTNFETQNNYSLRIRVADQNGLTFEKPFTISVMNVDESPTVSGFASESIQEDTPTDNLFFTIGDPETPTENLILSVSSSNTSLIPNANIVISGTGANRSLVLTPAANHSGSATITVTVSDGVLSSEQTLQVTVLAVDDPAVITLNSQPLDYRVSLRNVAIDESATLIDVDTPTLTFNGAVLRVSGQSAKDALLLLNLNGIRHKGRNVVSGTTVIGVFAGGKKGVPLTVSLNVAATQSAVQSLMRSIGFKSIDKAGGNRTIHMQITDIGGTNTNQPIRQIHIGSSFP